MKRFTKWRLVSIFAILALILSGCGEPFLSALTPAGEVAEMQYDLIKLTTVIIVGVITVVTVLFLFVIFKFRRKNDRIPKQVEGSHALEIIWTTIPIILVIILAVPTVLLTFKLADVDAMDKKNKDGKKDAVVVNVRASLYWWEFEYPDQKIITSQELVIPTDEKVYFNLKASDVKHSFWIPALGGKMDTNTDNLNKFWLEADSKKADNVKNIFYGKCAELCGPSHALMDFKVKTMSRSDFDKWVIAMQNAKKPEPVTAEAKAGEELFNKSCLACHAVTPQDARPEAARQAPNLAAFGDRNRIAGVMDHNEKELKKWLKDPGKYKPANKMTGTYGNLTDEQINHLTAYLMGLKVEK